MPALERGACWEELVIPKRDEYILSCRHPVLGTHSRAASHYLRAQSSIPHVLPSLPRPLKLCSVVILVGNLTAAKLLNRILLQ